MKVWVVETDVYEQRGISGVYSSLEKAIEANPPGKEIPEGFQSSAANVSRSGGWKEYEDGSWWNGLDWGFSASITPYEVDA